MAHSVLISHASTKKASDEITFNNIGILQMKKINFQPLKQMQPQKTKQ